MPGAAHGLPRDHQGRDPRRRRQHPRARPRTRRRAGDPPHPRPALRLGRLARAVVQGRQRPRGAASAPAACSPPRRGWSSSASASAWRSSRRATGTSRRSPSKARANRRSRPASPASTARRSRAAPTSTTAGSSRRPSSSSTRPRPRALAAAIEGGGQGIRHRTRVQARNTQPQAAVHHLDPAAGGRPQALDERQARDERRPAPLREGLHHLYAHRLDRAEHAGRSGGARAGGRAVRREGGAAQPARLPQQEQERPGGARGDPPVGRAVPHARRRWRASWTATSSACTT